MAVCCGDHVHQRVGCVREQPGRRVGGLPVRILNRCSPPRRAFLPGIPSSLRECMAIFGTAVTTAVATTATEVYTPTSGGVQQNPTIENTGHCRVLPRLVFRDRGDRAEGRPGRAGDAAGHGGGDLRDHVVSRRAGRDRAGDRRLRGLTARPAGPGGGISPARSCGSPLGELRATRYARTARRTAVGATTGICSVPT